MPSVIPLEVCDEHVVNHEIVSYVKQNLPPENLLSEISALFKVFGDLTRSRIICSLLNAELCVCDIAYLLDMSSSAISHQLRILKQARIVKSRREGKNIYYSLDDEHIEKLFDTAIKHMSETR